MTNFDRITIDNNLDREAEESFRQFLLNESIPQDSPIDVLEQAIEQWMGGIEEQCSILQERYNL